MSISSRPVIPRDWRLVAAIGAAAFAASFAAFTYLAPAAGMAEAALLAIAAMAVTIAVRAQALRTHNQRMRVALDNMSQGLCMFDASDRLVVCNKRYAEMYKLPQHIAQSGTTLLALLEYRAKHGTFSHTAAEYVVELKASMASGKTRSTEVKSADGRTILVTNRPMPGGGWVATHEDITDRRDAERERAVMQEQQARRTVIEQAIAAFRRRIEDHLRTVADGAMTMRSTAGTLLANSSQTSKSAERDRKSTRLN